MNTDQLKYFVTIAEMQHMSKAAEVLNISQPSLSLNIQKLEREVGCDLFDRVGRGIVLNDYGSVFLAFAKRTLAVISEGLETIDEMKHSRGKRIVIRMPSLSYYPDLQETIYAKHPGLTISNNDCRFSDLLPKMLAGQIDFCIVGKALPNSLLACSPLSKVRMVVLVSQNGPYALLDETDMTDFKDANFADLPCEQSSGVSELDDVCRTAGYAPNVTFVSYRMDDIINAVRYNGNVAWVPLHIMEYFNLANIHTIKIREPYCYSHLIMYWNKEALSKKPIASDIRKMTEQFFKEKGLG